MKHEPCLAIAGAGSLVGEELLGVLSDQQVPCADIRLFGSGDEIGEVYSVCGHEPEVEDIESATFEGVDILFCCLPALEAKEVAPRAVKDGARVIDLSYAHRLEEKVPLIVPDVNGLRIDDSTPLISTPHSLAIQLATVLHTIEQFSEVSRVVVSTYQAVSGAGQPALDELFEQTRAVFNQSEVTCEAFQHQIAFNCLPAIDLFLADGSTAEERRIAEETRKILESPTLPITVTAVRIPVFHGDAASLVIETKDEVALNAFIGKLESTPGVRVCNDSELPTHLEASGANEILVGRIRKDAATPRSIALWVVTDSTRRGAAMNAVETARRLFSTASA